jgi:hypothetical protein
MSNSPQSPQEPVRPVLVSPQLSNPPGAKQADKPASPSQATKLLNLTKTLSVDLFRSTQGMACARIPRGAGRRAQYVESPQFREWLEHEFYRAFNTTAPDASVQETIRTLKGKALFDSGTAQEVYVRVGGDRTTAYLDLADDSGRVVVITPDGWEVRTNVGVNFLQAEGMLPLPEPQRGGSVDLFEAFINADPAGRKVVTAFVLGALSPSGPYPLLELIGAQGSAKSTLTRKIRSIIDPNVAPARVLPGTLDNLVIQATNSHMLAFDNLSYITDSKSDLLCGLATGLGYGKRTNYTNTSETILTVCRPAIINGIENLVRRADLLDRSLTVELNTIPPQDRRSEAEIEAEFARVHPKVLGGFLDAAVMAMRNFATTKADKWPRLRDFAQWVTAAEPALGWASGTFLSIMSDTTCEANHRALDHYPGLVEALVTIVTSNKATGCGEWKGTPTDLAALLSGCMVANLPPVNQLTGELQRLTPALKAMGITVHKMQRTNKARLLHIKYDEAEGSNA